VNAWQRERIMAVRAALSFFERRKGRFQGAKPWRETCGKREGEADHVSCRHFLLLIGRKEGVLVPDLLLLAEPGRRIGRILETVFLPYFPFFARESARTEKREFLLSEKKGRIMITKATSTLFVLGKKKEEK